MVGVKTMPRRIRTAIVGTGLAGLTTAHLLQTDPQQRYSVTLFEKTDTLAFDSDSVAVKSQQDGTVDRIDLPMRASAGGYYANLNRMYRHLDTPVHPVRFLFARSPVNSPSPPAYASAASGGYFVHASNGHRVPPPRPASHSLPRHLVEIPRRYTTHYLLPLFSAVSTCTHRELLAFPTSDLVDYIARSYNQHHYAVCGGVQQVQARLVRGIADVRLRSRVIQVMPRFDEEGVHVRWQFTDPVTGKTDVREEAFDRVVIAVSPDVTGRIVLGASGKYGRDSDHVVESAVMALAEAATGYCVGEMCSSAHKCMHCRSTRGRSGGPAEVITLRTEFSGAGEDVCAERVGASEHELKRTLKTAERARTLRTVESRATVERIMRRVSREVEPGGGIQPVLLSCFEPMGQSHAVGPAISSARCMLWPRNRGRTDGSWL
ncbi:hypothetical protein B0T18DRAFT_388540 [Schizothecium vesticola]|uniref:Amine oxidase domain-containing protein n=1 Tax=Schizothecium vesticola TaxID=314040 RepID=A0AA40F7G1_9PEZI|nr:hypothetical protein B0T18DRAFT_388540 [Schizothecium vesticola]